MPSEPRVSLATDGGLFVVEAVVAEDMGFGIVGGSDLRAPVDDAVGLIEVHRCRHVLGNDFIVLPELANTVDLHGQHHRDTQPVEVPGQNDHGGGAPALSEQHDVGGSLLLLAEHAVLIGVKQVKDGFERHLAMAILENLDVGVFGEILLKALRDLDRAVVGVGVAHETADEADQDVAGGIGNRGNSAAFGGKERRGSWEKPEQRESENSESGETRHSELLSHPLTGEWAGMRQKI